ncbi:hypothetical protein Fmac_005475 [Flemingia macrophylla]|uniref:Mono-/di-acylglycerol lipase N-terminal domain-containing protein n=1 Tax=Flemingia macrophylla TaxID=520843 RepID=A0ABD1N7V1_9FABA
MPSHGGLVHHRILADLRSHGWNGHQRGVKIEQIGSPKRLSRGPAQAPATLLESIVMLSETLRFTYVETLGKWLIEDLAFNINYFMSKQVRICEVFKPNCDFECGWVFFCFWVCGKVEALGELRLCE